MIFEILPKTPNFQNVTDPKVPNQFSNLKMLWIAKTQMVNFHHSHRGGRCQRHTVDRQDLIRFRQELIPLRTLLVSYSRAKVDGFTEKLFYQGFIFCM